jgi:hypothetical protein
VLILAAAAFAEITAGGFDTLRGRFFDADQFCPRKIPFDLRDFDLDDFTHEHKWHKHDKIAHTPDALAAKRNVVNGQNQSVANVEWHWEKLQGAAGVKKIFRHNIRTKPLFTSSSNQRWPLSFR